MISKQEILNGRDKMYPADYTQEISDNIDQLLIAINKIRSAYGKPMKVTSGWRSLTDHLRIYREKGITDMIKIPLKSKHLSGQAVDVSDPNKELQRWCKANEDILEDAGLWLEDFSATPNWVHFQCVPPKSGKRWFMP